MTENPNKNEGESQVLDPGSADGGTDWKKEARKWEDRAKANKAELDSLQQAANSKKTDLEQALERIAKLEADNAAKESQIMRSAVASAKNIDPDLLVGSTREELEAHADRLLAWRGETTKHADPVIPLAGYQPTPPQADEAGMFVKKLFNKE